MNHIHLSQACTEYIEKIIYYHYFEELETSTHKNKTPPFELRCKFFEQYYETGRNIVQSIIKFTELQTNKFSSCGEIELFPDSNERNSSNMKKGLMRGFLMPFLNNLLDLNQNNEKKPEQALASILSSIKSMNQLLQVEAKKVFNEPFIEEIEEIEFKNIMSFIFELAVNEKNNEKYKLKWLGMNTCYKFIYYKHNTTDDMRKVFKDLENSFSDFTKAILTIDEDIQSLKVILYAQVDLEHQEAFYNIIRCFLEVIHRNNYGPDPNKIIIGHQDCTKEFNTIKEANSHHRNERYDFEKYLKLLSEIRQKTSSVTAQLNYALINNFESSHIPMIDQRDL